MEKQPKIRFFALAIIIIIICFITFHSSASTPLAIVLGRHIGISAPSKPVSIIYADTTISLKPDTQLTPVLYAIKLQLKLQKEIKNDTTITFTIIPDGLVTVKGQMFNPALKISKKDWDASLKTDSLIGETVYVALNWGKNITKPENFDINVANGDGRYHIKIIPKPDIKADSKKQTNPIIHIVPDIATINPLLSQTDTTKDTPLDVKLKIDTSNKAKLTSKNDTSISFGVYQASSNTVKAMLPLTKYDLLKADVATLNTGAMVTKRIMVRTNSVKSFDDSKDEFFYISPLKDTSRYNVHITTRGSYQDKPFWGEIGANFDLLDKLKTNNFYAGVYMFDKDIARISIFNKKPKKNKDGNAKDINVANKTDDNQTDNRDNNLSFTAGVYESQSVSLGLSSSKGFDYKDGASPVLNSNGSIKSYTSYRDTGRISTTTTIKNIGIFFSPHLRLTNGKTETNGLHLFFSLYAEMLWQRVDAAFDYSKQKNVYKISDSSANASTNFANLPYKEQSIDFDYRSHYIGLGLPLYIKENEFNLYMNTVFGKTTQRFVVVDKTDTVINSKQYALNIQNLSYNNSYNAFLNFAQPRSKWNYFYLFQFRLNEVAYGITFGGEIRGLFLNDSKPVITLSLSKKFSLSGLFQPLVAKYQGFQQ